MAIDTHIYRVCQRLRAIDAKTNADKAHDVMEAKVPPGEVFNFHVAFINHGRRVCRAQRPLCAECVVGEMCPSRGKLMAKAARPENGVPPVRGSQDQGRRFRHPAACAPCFDGDGVIYHRRLLRRRARGPLTWTHVLARASDKGGPGK